jgi:protein-S-isoprenylcysteine O-methyltransferase Ste14
MGMYFFFSLPNGPTRGVWMIRVLGFVFAAWNLAAVSVASPPLVRCALAWLSYGASLALFWWAWFGARNQPLPWAFFGVVGDRLHRVGAYAFVRHPFYLA